MLFCEGLRNLARTRKLVRLLLRQRWDEVKVLTCLQVMDEMERRAGLYVGMNGTHLDSSIVMVIALLGKVLRFG